MKIFRDLILDVENADGATTYTLAKLYVAENNNEYYQIIKWHESNGFSKDFEGIIADSQTLELISGSLKELVAKKITVFKKKNKFGVVKNF
ncbi:MAG: hypothetical protein ACP6IS_00595 [Candidatus Asgardarchaeia archaeon]